VLPTQAVETRGDKRELALGFWLEPFRVLCIDGWNEGGGLEIVYGLKWEHAHSTICLLTSSCSISSGKDTNDQWKKQDPVSRAISAS